MDHDGLVKQWKTALEVIDTAMETEEPEADDGWETDDSWETEDSENTSEEVQFSSTGWLHVLFSLN